MLTWDITQTILEAQLFRLAIATTMLSITSVHNAFYNICFANDACDTSKIAGCCAFKNLNSCKLQIDIMDTQNMKTLNVTGQTGPPVVVEDLEKTYQYTVHCFVRYYQAISTSANSGRIQISLSS